MVRDDKDGVLKLQGDTRVYIQCHDCKECNWSAQDIINPHKREMIKCSQCGTWNVFSYTEGLFLDDGNIMIVREE